MNEIGFIGEDTRLVPAPPIPATENPNPKSYTVNPFQNTEIGITNATFQLWSTGTLPPNTNLVMKLHQQTTYKSAMITLEAASGANKDDVLARFWQDGTHPSNTNGLPLKHMGVIEIRGTENVKNFRIITADDKPHTINVQYFV
jgi:hypothetical protein